MADLGTPLAQVATGHASLATSNVPLFPALLPGSAYVKISAFNDLNQDVDITVNAVAIQRLKAGMGVIIDSMETGNALGITPAADPTSGTFYMTAYTS